MSAHVTGQQARDLLDGSTPGPWTAYGIMRHPETPTCIVGPDGQQIAGSMMGDGVEHRDSDLVKAAPQLAETIAWLYGREPDEGGVHSAGLTEVFGADDGIVVEGLATLTLDEAEDLARAILSAVEKARCHTD